MKRFAVAALLVVWSAVLAGQSFTLSPPPFLLAQTNAGAIINNACVWTYTAGTTTPATTYSDNTGTPNLNPIRSDSAGRFVAFLVPGSAYKFTYETACTPPAHGTVLKTVDGILGTPGSTAGGDISGVAGENITAGQVVYLSDGTCGGCVAGNWYKADNSAVYSSIGVEIGVAPSSISSAATGTIRLLGVVTGLSGLTAGQPYYISTAGALTATPSGSFVRRVGQANTTTSLVLDNPAAQISRTLVFNNVVNVTVANTATITQILNVGIPGNMLGTYRAVRVTITGFYTNNGGGPDTFTLDGSYGGQTFVSSGIAAFANGSSGPMSFVIILNALGATNAQAAHVTVNYPTSGVLIGLSALGVELLSTAYNNTLTVNSTTGQNFIVAVTHSLANAATSYKMFSATFEAIGQ